MRTINQNDKKCGWCGADTKRIYRLKDGRYLCYDCAVKHYKIVEEKMNRHIEEVNYGLKKKREKLTELLEAMCDHEELINTGYCVGKENNIKQIFKCKKCSKTIYK